MYKKRPTFEEMLKELKENQKHAQYINVREEVRLPNKTKYL